MTPKFRYSSGAPSTPDSQSVVQSSVLPDRGTAAIISSDVGRAGCKGKSYCESYREATIPTNRVLQNSESGTIVSLGMKQRWIATPLRFTTSGPSFQAADIAHYRLPPGSGGVGRQRRTSDLVFVASCVVGPSSELSGLRWPSLLRSVHIRFASV